MEIFQQNGLREHIEELLDMISTRWSCMNDDADGGHFINNHGSNAAKRKAPFSSSSKKELFPIQLIDCIHHELDH
jgi:hypothetical protein